MRNNTAYWKSQLGYSKDSPPSHARSIYRRFAKRQASKAARRDAKALIRQYT